MRSVLEKGLALLEFLARRPDGASVTDAAKALDLPPSGTHRVLKELEACGYVRQDRDHGEYRLTLKLATEGMCFLTRTGIPDLSQPILDTLAERSQELVRLALADGDELVWVGVSQGATSGLRYDPQSDQGRVAHLASAACGHAWLSGMSDEDALALVMKQGLEKPDAAGVSAPRSIAQLMEAVHTARKNGYAVNANSFMLGMAAIAMLVRDPETGTPIGTVSIAGPAARATPDLLRAMLPDLRKAAEDLGEASLSGRAFLRGRETGVEGAAPGALTGRKG